MENEETKAAPTEYAMKIQTVCLMAVQLFNASQVSPGQAVATAFQIYNAVEAQMK